jgi:tetratricopeptide (TPR) repeat protein
MIHAYDNPMHAPLGLRAASRYSRIAAHAAHALHMTSHIFFALGMWDKAVTANEASWAASAARVERKRLAPSEHGYHASLWLSYAYLQQGRTDDARRVVNRMGQLLAEARARTVAYHYAAGRAALVIDSERWTDVPPRPEVSLLGPAAHAAGLFADGLAAARRGDVAGAQDALAALETLAQTAVSSEAHHGISAVSEADRQGVAVTARQLAGVVALTRGDQDRGLGLLQQAVEAEGKMPYDYGPPFPAKPANELLGEALLAAGRHAEAAEAFRAALKRAPGRRLSVRGLAEAERAAPH